MTPDQKIDSLLRAVTKLEPGPGFEEAVWRRLRAREPVPVQAWGGWVIPLALAAGLVAGIGLGLLFPGPGKTAGATPAMVQIGSLTGAYLMLASGGGE